ncbi:hypothetical protein ACIO3O_01555 [Streptomyces sp. NPDC087440]|uniref:hypothetical protein n=1 Tax=Streptomyces sp. NPDC087440 TaxID=3365790 RepID=UPI00381C59F2
MRRSAILISITGISAIAVLGTACSSGTDGKAPAPGGQAQKTSSAQTPAPTPSADPAAAVRAAVDAAGNSTARIDEAIRLTGGGQDFTITVKGAFDMKADKGTLKASLAQTGGTAQKPVPLDEIFSDDTVYVRMPSERNGDTGWRAIQRDKTEVHYLLRAPANDPEHVLRQVSMAHDVTEVGQEKVNGTSAVHYRGKLDSKALLLRMAKDRRELMAGPLEAMGDSLPAFADVWLGKDGRIVRITLGCDLGQGKVTATMNLTGRGEPVTLPALPKNARTVPAASLGGPLGG